MIPHQYRLWQSNPWLGVAAVSAVALAVRLWSLETVPFNRDEATLVFGIQDVLSGEWPTKGDGSSWGITTHPMVFYLRSIPYALFGPAGVVAVLAIESALAVALITWLCTRQLGMVPGLLAGSLYAAAPWSIFFGRQPWTEVDQLLQALAIVGATRLLMGGAGWWSAVVILAVAVNGLEYFLGNVLWASLLFAVSLSPRRWLNRWSVGAIIVVIGIALPYLIGLVPELSRWPQLAMQRGKPFNLSELPKAVGILKMYLGGANLESLWGTSLAEQFPLKDLMFRISDLALPFFGIGLISLVGRRRSYSGGFKRLWFGWTIPPLAVLLFQPGPEHLHYVSVLMPLPFLWLASLFAEIWRWPVVRGPLLAGACFVAAIWVAGWLLIVDGMASPLNTPSQSTLGSWTHLLKSVPYGDNYDVYVIASGYSPEYAGEPAVIRALMPSQRNLNFLESSIGLIRPRPTAYIVTRSMPVPTLGGEPLPGVREVASSPAGRILLVPAGEDIQLPRAATPVVPPIKFSDGPELIGFQVTPQMDAIDLTTFWRMGDISSRAARADLTMFNHYLDENDMGISQTDGFGLPSSAWQKGYFASQRYRISAAPDVLARGRKFYVGIYSRREGNRARVIDPQPGQPIDGVFLPITPYSVPSTKASS